MSTVEKVMAQLKKLGTEQTRKTFARHGAPSNMFGVSIADLKTVAKTIKGEQALACALYETGNIDAMYLAGLVADGSRMTMKQLESWAAGSTWGALSAYTVPWVATESPHARKLALKWMKSKSERIASSGWCTYAGIVSTRPDEELDLAEIQSLLDQVVKQIHNAPNQVRSVMNGFVIAVGTYVKPLLKQAKAAADAIGVVSVDMGDTACKVPLASDYIKKSEKTGKTGKKRKTMKC